MLFNCRVVSISFLCKQNTNTAIKYMFNTAFSIRFLLASFDAIFRLFPYSPTLYIYSLFLFRFRKHMLEIASVTNKQITRKKKCKKGKKSVKMLFDFSLLLLVAAAFGIAPAAISFFFLLQCRMKK